MRVGIATVRAPFVRGGAELLAEGLLGALRNAGHEAEIISIPFKWYPAQRIPQALLACRLMDVSESCGVPIDRLICLKFPAYLMPHPGKVLWLLHQYRGAYDAWDTEIGDLINAPDGAHIRQIIRTADQSLIPECRKVFTISHNVSRRLAAFNGIRSVPVYHPPPLAERFRAEGYGDFLLMPSRVNASKRQALVVEALACTKHPVPVVFIGETDAAEYADSLQRRCAQLDIGRRVNWMGGVDDDQKCALYAKCLAIVFPPLDEDYGYVTLEAMLSAKPVITCTDSGGPLEFVVDRQTGMICEPNPESLAEIFDLLWENRTLARNIGQAARIHYAEMELGWDTVLDQLLG